MIYLPHIHKPPFGVKLNRNHPLAQGLIGCWLMNEGGGDTVFDLSGNQLHGLLTSDGTTVKPEWRGNELYFDGTDTGKTYIDIGTVDIPGQGTCIFEVIKTEAATSNRFFGGADNYELKTNSPGDWRNELGLSSNSTASSNIPVGQRVTQAHSYIFDVSTAIYLDGKLNTSDTFPDSPSITSLDLTIGRRSDLAWSSTNNFFTGYLRYFYFYDRVLTSQEIQSLYAQPYQIFEPMFLPSAVAATEPLQHGDKYQVVWNGSEWVITWTDDTALADETLFNIGVDPEGEAAASSGINLSVDLTNTSTTTTILQTLAGEINLSVGLTNTSTTTTISRKQIIPLTVGLTNTSITATIARMQTIPLTVSLTNTSITTTIDQFSTIALTVGLTNTSTTTTILQTLVGEVNLSVDLTNTSTTATIARILTIPLTVGLTNTSTTTTLDIFNPRTVTLSVTLTNTSTTSGINRAMIMLLSVGLTNTSLTSIISSQFESLFPDLPPPQQMLHKIIKNNITKQFASGYTVSVAGATGVKREFSVTYTNLTTTEKNLLSDFFDLIQGQIFTWNHPESGTGAFNVGFIDKNLNFKWISPYFWSVTFKLVEL